MSSQNVGGRSPHSEETHSRFRAPPGAIWYAIAGLAAWAWAFWFVRFWSTSPPERLVASLLDDAYYYSVVAANIVQGHGSTFDGEALTNGYHPLWMLMQIALAMIPPLDPHVLISRIATVSALLYLATGVTLSWALFRVAGLWPGALVALLFVVSPYSTVNTTYGLEGPLVSLTTVLLLWSATSYLERVMRATQEGVEPEGLSRAAAVFGLAGGCHFLARTDGAFLICLLYFPLLLQCRLKHDAQPWQWRIYGLHVAFLSTICLTLPWIFYNWVSFDQLMQNSGQMKMLWRQTMLSDQSWETSAKMTMLQVFQYAWHVVETLPGRTSARFGFNSLLIALFGVLLVGINDWRRIMTSAPFLVGSIGICSTVAMGLYYATHFAHILSWYYSSASITTLWFLATGIEEIERSLSSHDRSAPTRKNRVLRTGTYCLAVVIVIAGVLGLFQSYSSLYSGHESPTPFYKAAIWAKTNLPQDAVIGGYSSGYLGMFSERKVINLDGLANNEIESVFSKRTMANYLETRQVSFLIDYESILGHLWRDAPGWTRHHLEEVARFPAGKTFGDVVVFKVDWSGTVSSPPSGFARWEGIWPLAYSNVYFARLRRERPLPDSSP